MALGDVIQPSTEPQVTSRNLDVTRSTDIQTPIWLTPESWACLGRQNRGWGPATAPPPLLSPLSPHSHPYSVLGVQSKASKFWALRSLIPSVPSVPTAPHPQPVGSRSWSGTCFLWTSACEHPSRPFPRPQPGDVQLQRHQVGGLEGPMGQMAPDSRVPGGFADGLGPGEGPPPHPAARPNAMASHEAGRTPTASLLDFTENKPQTSDA